MSAFWGELSL